MNDPITLPPKVSHGSTNAYGNLGCRCERCTLAWRNYQLKYGPVRRAKSLPADDPRHGSYSGYANYACRCEACKEANRVYSVGYRCKRGSLSIEKAHALGWKGEEVE